MRQCPRRRLHFDPTLTLWITLTILSISTRMMKERPPLFVRLIRMKPTFFHWILFMVSWKVSVLLDFNFENLFRRRNALHSTLVRLWTVGESTQLAQYQFASTRDRFLRAITLFAQSRFAITRLSHPVLSKQNHPGTAFCNQSSWRANTGNVRGDGHTEQWWFLHLHDQIGSFCKDQKSPTLFGGIFLQLNECTSIASRWWRFQSYFYDFWQNCNRVQTIGLLGTKLDHKMFASGLWKRKWNPILDVHFGSKQTQPHLGAELFGGELVAHSLFALKFLDDQQN